MATKQELQSAMKNFGYDLNPFTSKETLVNLLRLHVKVRRRGAALRSSLSLVFTGFRARCRCPENERSRTPHSIEQV